MLIDLLAYLEQIIEVIFELISLSYMTKSLLFLGENRFFLVTVFKVIFVSF